jgi:hypothetical protein
LRDSQTAPWREVQRARILWRYHSGENIAAIARAVKMTRTSVAAALKDDYHRPRAPVITEEAKAWVVHVACCKPKEFGYARAPSHTCRQPFECASASLAKVR